MIRVRELTKDYLISQRKHLLSRKEITTVHAVKGISFTIEDGEKVGLIGLNGSGKTTCIKMLTGILTQSRGYVEVNGFSPQKRENAFLAQIGVGMGQRSSLFFDIPLRYSFEYYRDVYGIADYDYHMRLNEFDSFLDIKSLMNTPVRKLSFGQRMKSELVCAMLHKPQILFLDEPTIGLDVVTKDKIFKFLDSMNKKYGCTVLLTTHELENIEKFCTRILVLKSGAIIYDGEISGFCAMNQYRKICISAEEYQKCGFEFDSVSETERGVEIVLDANSIEYLEFMKKTTMMNFTVASLSLEDMIKLMELDSNEIIEKSHGNIDKKEFGISI